MSEDEARFNLTDEAYHAALEEYDKMDVHSFGVRDAIHAALKETPTWIIEQYVMARRMNEE